MISFKFFVCFIFNVSLGSAPKRKNFDIQCNTRVASGRQFTLNYHTPSLIKATNNKKRFAADVIFFGNFTTEEQKLGRRVALGETGKHLLLQVQDIIMKKDISRDLLDCLL